MAPPVNNNNFQQQHHPLLHKSKSYDTRLNRDENEEEEEDELDNSLVYNELAVHRSPPDENRYSYYDDNLNTDGGGGDSGNVHDLERQKTTTEETDVNEGDTRIIVTSFAPKPDKSRPMSHQAVVASSYSHPSVSSLDTSVKADGQDQ
jgi:hypothetical protein